MLDEQWLVNKRESINNILIISLYLPVTNVLKDWNSGFVWLRPSISIHEAKPSFNLYRNNQT